MHAFQKSVSLLSILLISLLFVATGCESQTTSDETTDEESSLVEDSEDQPIADEEPSELVLKAQDLADLRKAIEEESENTEEILASHETTIEEVEAALFEISLDPEASAAYAEASKP